MSIYTMNSMTEAYETWTTPNHEFALTFVPLMPSTYLTASSDIITIVHGLLYQMIQNLSIDTL